MICTNIVCDLDSNIKRVFIYHQTMGSSIPCTQPANTDHTVSYAIHSTPIVSIFIAVLRKLCNSFEEKLHMMFFKILSKQETKKPSTSESSKTFLSAMEIDPEIPLRQH